jgi:hypothetical protein
MSENERGESGSIGAFLLGFLTGVLVCVGIGGGFFLVVGRQATMREQMRAEEARMMAEDAAQARAEAEMQRREADAARLRAEAQTKKLRQKAEESEKKAKKDS